MATFCCLVKSSHNVNWPRRCVGPKIQPALLPLTGNLNGIGDVGEDLLLQEVARKELP